MVIIVAVHEWTSRLWNKNSEIRYLVKSWEKTGEYTKKLEQVNLELNPLLTLPGIQTDLYWTFLFSSVPTNLIHVDLTEPFCRFQLNIQRTACCFELHVLGWFWVDFYHKCQESGSWLFKLPNSQTGEYVT